LNENLRTVAALPSPAGAAVVRVIIEGSMRWLQVVAGAKAGVVLYVDNPGQSAGVSLVNGTPLERNGQTVYVGGRTDAIWVSFDSISLDTDAELVINGSRDLQPPPVWPGAPVESVEVSNFPATQVVSLDYDAHHAERLDLEDNTSKSVSTGTLTELHSTVTALTYPNKWRSVFVSIGNMASTTVDMDAILILIDKSVSNQGSVLATAVNNKRGGGFPLVSFPPPPFDWCLAIANESGVNLSVLVNTWYSTSEPSGPVTR
jgi:hypothetical protein